MKKCAILTILIVSAIQITSPSVTFAMSGGVEHDNGSVDNEHDKSSVGGESKPDATCNVLFGPQSPRDLNKTQGDDKSIFSMAPEYKKMNLCNIHFHNGAEHKAKAFAIYVGPGEKGGHGSGYQCGISKSLTRKELSQTSNDICHGLVPGDTIEVHWVFSSCAVKPGQGLGSCLSNECANPNLRVEAQVFTLVNDKSALNFNKLSYDGYTNKGYYQPKSLPTNTGRGIKYLGSTTGPSYDAFLDSGPTLDTCSALQVTWNVRPQCAKLDINSLGRWCGNNVFNENHAHGVRQIVTRLDLLSKIR